MSTKSPSKADLLRPIRETSTAYYVLVAVAAIAFGLFLLGWAYQLAEGMIVTGLGDWGTGGGVTWGIYIGAFIWWVGIAHGGIILSAAVRLLGMERYMPVARLAELLTLGALSAAGFYIVVHLGRPDRMVTSVIGHYHITVNNSPLVWDVTVITAYFVLTATYLALTLRYDISRLRDDLPDRYGPIYSLLTIGYSEREDAVIQRMVWWIALAIIIMAPLLLHGGVIPWLFAVIPSMPRWFGAVQGPQFLTIALTSAISGVIILSAAFRRAYDWDHIITDDVFRGLLLWLGFFSLLFLWLQLQQVTAGSFAPPIDLSVVWSATLSDPIYIVAMLLVGLVLAFIFAQTLRPSLFSRGRAIVCAVAVLTATLLEKVLFVVEGMFHPSFEIYAATPGYYIPSLIEIASVIGTIGMVSLFFLLVAKIVPVLELHAIEHLQAEHQEGRTSDHASRQSASEDE